MKELENKRFRIYIAGNELFEEDSFPIKILELLKKDFREVEFCMFDPTEDFPDEENLFIIDTIINIDKVVMFNYDDLKNVSFQKTYSLHDYDLGTHLLLLKKIGKLREVAIIGVPPLSKIDEKAAINDIKKIISNLILKNV